MLTVGPKDGDVVGIDNTAIQAAVDRVGAVGGGVVRILPGTYLMSDSLHLRSGVTVRGSGPDTVLRKNVCVASELCADLGYGHFDISLARPERFRVGMGVHIADDNSGGFYGTVATLTWQHDDRFGISRMLNHDYSRGRNATVRSVFPVISGYHLTDAAVEHLTVDGNAAENENLNGCRGGGIFLLQTRRLAIRHVCVHHYHGDGISFQQGLGTLIEDTVCEENLGCGLHPGSGSVAPVMRRVTCRANTSDGIFYCLRVTYSLCEHNTLTGNGHDGISIGGRDTDHLIRDNVIEGHPRHGIYFRAGDHAMAGHRCRLDNNRLGGNCTDGAVGEIRIDGDVQDVQIAGNTIQCPTGTALQVASPNCRVAFHDNRVDAATAVGFEPGVEPSVVHEGAPDRTVPVGPGAAPPWAHRHLE